MTATTVVAATPVAPEPLFEERIGATRRAWTWFLVIVAVTFVALGPIFVPVAAVAWLINVFRYRRARVRIDGDELAVGKRRVRLAALDLTTLGRAGNTWPWRAFNRRYLGANPIWTRDSVAVRGIDAAYKPYWVAVGTNRRDELVAALERAVPAAKERAIEAAASALPPPGWHPDPWDPVAHWRWWDGQQWTGHTAPQGPS
jgi:hypothetical protein